MATETEEAVVEVKKSVTEDAGTEAEVTVTLAPKKTTTTTTVEVVKKVDSDGKVQETKTTETKTIINGKVENKKVVETKIAVAEDEEELDEEIEDEEVEEEEIIEEEEEEVEEEPEVVTTVTVQKTVEPTKEVKKVESNVTHEVTEQKTTKVTVTVDEKPSIEQVKDKDEEEEIVVENEEQVSEPAQQEEQKVTETIKVVEKVSEEKVAEENVVEEKVAEEKVESKIEVPTTQTKEPEVELAPASEVKVSDDNNNVEQLAKAVESKPIPPITGPVTLEKKTPSEILQSLQQPKADTVHVKTESSETKTEVKGTHQAPETVTTSQKESTEITSSVAQTQDGRPVSTQTELHHVENVVTVNKTTATLNNIDRAYEQIANHGVPTVKTYFVPPREPVSPQPARPYESSYVPENKPPERRHSLLLERLSTERQMTPTESATYRNSYQSSYSNQTVNQSYESSLANQWNQAPNSEVVNVSNVKPSSLANSNQQWYNQSQKENVYYNNTRPEAVTPQPQPPQAIYVEEYQQPASYLYQPTQAPVYSPATAPAYSPAPNSAYSPAPAPTLPPSSWGQNNLGSIDRLPSLNSQQSQYSFLSNTDSYNTTSQQQYGSGYVPPPWETEGSTNLPESTPQTYYQAPLSTTPIASTPVAHAPAWQPPQATPKLPKKASSYTPPAPNASFVTKAKPATSIFQHPGKKTYYSEYERRYVTVPETSYVPADSRTQPDPSPKYYYDNNEPQEEVEPSWRKELREFTEKSSQQITSTETTTQNYSNTEQTQHFATSQDTTVQPPWESQPNYVAKNPTLKYTPTPSWSQTLRPRSWREQSFESESLQYQNTQEWPKSSTLNRRPVSSFVKSQLEQSSERTRGVSVDRYNPSSYLSPISPNSYSLPWENSAQSQVSPQYDSTQFSGTPAPTTPLPSVSPQPKLYHNPNVPAYHARAPTEPREHTDYSQKLGFGQNRSFPIQSRSFKYLQMLTGTEDGVTEPEPFVVQPPLSGTPRPKRV